MVTSVKLNEYDGRQIWEKEAEIDIVMKGSAAMKGNAQEKEQQQHLVSRHAALRRRQETQLEAAEIKS